MSLPKPPDTAVPPSARTDTAGVPVQTYLRWCTWFTLGITLLGTTVPMLVLFGIAFTILGLAPFFSERLVLRFMIYFLGLLGLSLLYVLQGLRLGDGWPSSLPKPPIWYAAILIVGWGAGILFGFRRWRASRAKGAHEA